VRPIVQVRGTNPDRIQLLLDEAVRLVYRTHERSLGILAGLPPRPCEYWLLDEASPTEFLEHLARLGQHHSPVPVEAEDPKALRSRVYFAASDALAIKMEPEVETAVWVGAVGRLNQLIWDGPRDPSVEMTARWIEETAVAIGTVDSLGRQAFPLLGWDGVDEPRGADGAGASGDRGAPGGGPDLRPLESNVGAAGADGSDRSGAVPAVPAGPALEEVEVAILRVLAGCSNQRVSQGEIVKRLAAPDSPFLTGETSRTTIRRRLENLLSLQPALIAFEGPSPTGYFLTPEGWEAARGIQHGPAGCADPGVAISGHRPRPQLAESGPPVIR
jgi:hypothetical protein